jgi:hypothetical protein
VIEPINQELSEYLDSLAEGDFSGVYIKPKGCQGKRRRSKATPEKIEELKGLIQDKDYMDKAVNDVALKLACLYGKK